MRKVILPAFTVFIIFSTTLIFDHTQSFFKSFAQGARYFKAKRYEESLPLFITAHKMQPQNMKAASYLLWNYERLGMKKEAEDMLNIAWGSGIEDAGVAEEFADAFYILSKYPKAETLYRKILAQKVDIDVKRKLTEILTWQKKYGEATLHLEELVKKRPRDLELLEFLADVSSWAKRYDKAIELYKKLLSGNYRTDDITLKLADVLRYSGKDEEAIQLYREYLKRKK